MDKRMMRLAALAASMVMFLPALAAAASITLSPAANLSGAPGATIGWGYRVVADVDRDVSVASIAADPILAADGSLSLFVFDFPFVTAGTTLQTNYDPLLGRGLLELTLAPTLAPGQVVAGRVFGELLLTDPAGVLPSQVAAFALPFSATASVTSVPEPSTLILLGSGAIGALVRRRVKRQREAHNRS